MPAEQTATLRFTAVDRVSGVVDKIKTKVASVSSPVNRVRTAMANLANTPGMEALSGAVSKLQGRIGALSAAAGGALTALAGAAGGAVVLARDVSEATEHIGGLAERYQASTEAIQVYGSLIGGAGGTADDAAKAMGKLGQAMTAAFSGDQDARKAFQAIGIGVDELRTMSKEQILEHMADAFSKSENSIAKQNIALKLMGEQGTLFMETLNEGAGAYAERAAQMRADGALITDEDVQKAQNFNDALERLEHAGTGLRTDFGLAVAESVVPVVEQLRELIDQNRDRINAVIDRVAQRLPAILSVVGTVGGVLFGVFDTLLGVVGSLVDTFGPMPLAIAGLAVAFAPVLSSIVSVTSAVLSIGPAAAKVVAGLVGSFGAVPMAIVGGVVASVAAVIKNWDEVVAYVTKSWENVKSAFSEGIFSGLMTALQEVVRGVVNGLFGVIRSTMESFGLGSMMPDWLKNFYMPSTSEVAEDQGAETPATSVSERSSSYPQESQSNALTYPQTEAAGTRLAQAQSPQRMDANVRIVVEGKDGARARVQETDSTAGNVEVTTRRGFAFEGDF